MYNNLNGNILLTSFLSVWLTDLSSQLPASTQLDGFDIVISQAPPKDWLPANVTIRQWDIFTDVAEEFVEKYDIVHVRLLVFVLKGDPIPILRNLLKMLSMDNQYFIEKENIN